MTLPAGGRLGETTDPRKLVLGSPERVEANATRLADEARRIKGLAEDLDAVTTPGWTGGEGQPAYAAALSAERRKWTAYRTLLEDAAASLTTYAGALRTAQSSAQDAIDLWEQGEQETRTARAEYNEAVRAYNAYVTRPPVLVPRYGAGAPTVPTLGPAHPGVFVDPGQAKRDEAQQILDDARETLDEAGATAVRELGGLEGSRTEGETDWFGAEGSAEGPSFSWDWWEDTFGRNPADGRGGRYADEHESRFKITLGSAEGSAWVFRTRGEWEDYFGGVRVHAEGSATFLGANGSAEATLDSSGVRINADGELVLVGGEGEVGGEWGYAEGTVTGSASVEGSGEGHAIFDETGVHAGGELFAGARGEIGVEGDVGGVGGGVSAEGWAGAGIAGDVDVGYDDGKVTIGGSGGIALGLGGKLSGEVTLDFPEMLETGEDIIEGIGGLLS